LATSGKLAILTLLVAVETGCWMGSLSVHCLLALGRWQLVEHQFLLGGELDGLGLGDAAANDNRQQQY
jgi:hypothetical protein